MTFYTYSVHFQVKYVVTSYEFLAQNQACTNNRVCNCDLNGYKEYSDEDAKDFYVFGNYLNNGLNNRQKDIKRTKIY